LDFNNKITALEDTIPLMQSEDYKDQFKAEYYQLKIRYGKLRSVVEGMNAGTLNFTPTCPEELLLTQLSYMERYMVTLEHRAELEEIKL
jgi:hypothetical protein